MTNIQEMADQVFEQLQRDERLGQYVYRSLQIPEPYCGVGKIRLIVLGQDPTVKDAQARQAIKTVLKLAQFGVAPALTLGQPLLGALVNQGIPNQVRHYWGYTSEWKSGQLLSPQYVKPQDNRLGRLIFPFPHQPSLRKQFYKERMRDYTSFVKTTAFS